MITNGFRFRVGMSLVLGLSWTSAAIGGGPLFGPPVHYVAGHAPESVAIGDLDGDQAPDLAVANRGSDNVSVLLNQTSGMPGDLDGDGDADMDDLPHFVDALLGNPPAHPGIDQSRADMNADSNLDGNDIQGFVNRLLSP